MRYVRRETIERRAQHLLSITGSLRLPVPVETVAHQIGAAIELVAFGPDVSGVLVSSGNAVVIGVNEAHSTVRRRFTIAHEIGHYVLHKKHSGLFIDKEYTAVFRDSQSSSGKVRIEIQANEFAAALLMPEQLITKEVRRLGFDLANDDVLRELSEGFLVSQQAMIYRLSNLELFNSSSRQNSVVRKKTT